MYSVRASDALEARDQLVKLWSDNLPVRGALDAKLRWFYCDGPHGPGRAFLLHSRDATVGCAGIGERALLNHGHPLRVALFADLAIDRRHRSGLPAMLLLRSVRNDIEREYDLGYGFPNRHARAVYLRSGYRELGHMYRYVRVLRTRGYLQPTLDSWWTAPLATIADGALAGLARTHAFFAREFSLIWPETFDARFDELWFAARDRFPIACARTASFLRWRFAREPHRIAAITPRGSSELVAYAVMRPGEDGCMDIVDLFGVGERQLAAMLARLVPAIDRLGFHAVGCRFLGNLNIVDILHAQGFVRRGCPRSVMVTNGRTAALRRVDELEFWYLTDLDEDT
jgi:hypothetical protein